MKNILLLVHDDEGQEVRLQTALDLVRALDGHLTCVDVTPQPFLASGDAPLRKSAPACLNERCVAPTPPESLPAIQRRR